MRFGITILTDLPWAEAGPRWQAAEDMGFDHAWTYDHLVWGGLPESLWRGAVPALAAAATTTERIGLGTFVSSPNFRHPVPLYRDLQALEDISAGRILFGVGTGGDRDSRILGDDLTVGERTARLREFVDLLLRLRAEDHVSAEGRWFSANDARTLPALTRTPVLVAANGPRSIGYAARVGDGWVTYGGPADDLDAWFAGLAERRDTLESALADTGRDPAMYPRYLNLDGGPRFALESADLFAEMVDRADQTGFTDVVTHWPRPDGPYAGSEAVLEQVAGHLGTA